MQIRNLCKFEPAGQTAYCIGFLAMFQFINLPCSDYLVHGKTHRAILVKINSHFVFAKTEPLICIVH